jgi:hypothetical protein
MKKRWRDWPDKLAYPYLDPATSVLDAVIQRAKSDGVGLVMVSGNPQRIPSSSISRTAQPRSTSTPAPTKVTSPVWIASSGCWSAIHTARRVAGEMWPVLAQVRVGNLPNLH